MESIVVDESLRQRLHNLNESLELRDETGHLLGYFTPAPELDRDTYDELHNLASAEDVAQLRLQSPGRPLADILADFEKQ